MRILIANLLIVSLALIMAKAESNIQALSAVTESTNQFSTAVFQTVIEENPGNLIMSPLSAAVVLAMAAYGASGETENQFRKLLRLPSPDSLATTGYQALIDNLNNIQENKLLLANKVFTAENFDVKPSYKDLTETYFRSATQLLNFAKSEEAANIINTWVQQSTNNLIKELVNSGDLNSLTALVLVNAVYFKGQWKNKFDSDFTKDMPFHINKDTVKNVPTMYRQGTYKYGQLPDLDAKFIVLPYKGDELSMVIILPNEIDGLAEVEKKLQNISLANILNQGFEREVQLYLPKFKVESKIELNNVLEKMGLTDAFTSHANFSGISDQNLAISKVLQKAFIEVNEEGSEAAAATGVMITTFSGVFSMEFMADRPFFFSIIKPFHNKKTNILDATTIFAGHVNKP